MSTNSCNNGNNLKAYTYTEEKDKLSLDTCKELCFKNKDEDGTNLTETCTGFSYAPSLKWCILKKDTQDCEPKMSPKGTWTYYGKKT